MNLVSAAMRRPITVIVALIAVVLSAVFFVSRMPRDVFPDLGVPVIYVAQPYGGVDPAQMEGFLTYYYEYHFLYITGIEHVESKSVQGNALVKLQFYPGTNMAQAMAETVSYVNRARAFMPPGTVPPFVTRFDAGSVPVGDLVFSSENRTVAEIQDAALNRVRPLFATLPGVSAPPPFGGSARSIVIHADPDRLRSYHLSPDDVVAAISATNTIAPSGNVRVGDMMPIVPVNATVPTVKELESVPIRTGSTQTVFVHDIGTVEDGSDIATGYALVNGRRTVYIPVTKRADASTLSVVALVKANLSKFQAVLPDGVKVEYQFDQSPYVTGAIVNLLTESALGAVLTGVMVLLFLRDLRSALIIVLNIPLALLAATLALALTGQTINIMTLGGLALAVGILVDEATVTIENVHTHLARGKTLARSALDASAETALPRLLAMLCILAVFTPAFFMTGAARSLFLPLSLAVGFSMIASYLLSSTLVPVLTVWVMKARKEGHGSGAPDRFSNFQERYRQGMQRVVKQRGLVITLYLVVTALIIGLVGTHLGTEIFPKVDAGQFQLRLRAPTGTRIERTEAIAQQTLEVIKQEAGADNVQITLGFVGVQAPSYPINTIHLWTSGPEEAVLQVQLKQGAHVPIEALKERLRKRLAAEMPDLRLSFEPSDIVSRVMSFGSPTPVEIAISGPTLAADQEYAVKVHDAMQRIPSLRDIQFGQSLDYPTLQINIDRERAGVMGLTTTDIARSTVVATSSSRFTAPNYWADPKSGIAYQVQVDVPIAKMNSAESIGNIPITAKNGTSLLLREVATVTPGTAVGEYDRYNSQRMVTITANVVGEDLGTASGRIEQALKQVGVPPPKVTVSVRGQVPAMQDMLGGLRTGFLLAVVVILLLLAANFQSPRLALIVVSTVPAVIAGVAVALWVTGTTLNIQSYMGAIMAVGVAVANAILLVTFAERSRVGGAAAPLAAVEGAQSRLRPILMTSLAMIAGMIPMALGLGEGGQQTAPLGRAVIGGLSAATLATLLILPSVFAALQSRASTRSASLDPTDTESAHFLTPVREGVSQPRNETPKEDDNEN
ncbi:MAG: swrC [Chthonomonadaceae bacterium]|nr:swrC [Chthonomonadaceae bacterium]